MLWNEEKQGEKKEVFEFETVDKIPSKFGLGATPKKETLEIYKAINTLVVGQKIKVSKNTIERMFEYKGAKPFNKLINYFIARTKSAGRMHENITGKQFTGKQFKTCVRNNEVYIERVF